MLIETESPETKSPTGDDRPTIYRIKKDPNIPEGHYRVPFGSEERASPDKGIGLEYTFTDKIISVLMKLFSRK